MKKIYCKKRLFYEKIFELPLPPPPPELYPATIKPLDPQLVAVLGKLSHFTLRWQMVHCQTSYACLVWIRLMHTHYINLAACNNRKQLENWKVPLIINCSAPVCALLIKWESIFSWEQNHCVKVTPKVLLKSKSSFSTLDNATATTYFSLNLYLFAFMPGYG